MSRTTPDPAPVVLLDLGPVAQLRAGRLGRRLVQLFLGLLVYGLSLALMVEGALGVAPWDVMHLAITRYVPLTLGQVVIVASFVVLLAWIPLREKPGLGTVANAFVVGLSTDAALAVLPTPDSLTLRIAFVVLGVVLNAVATAFYIGAQLGRGPRDGLMTGLARRTGASLRLVRTSLEVSVVAAGLALGGRLGAEVGAGTVLYALAIGPLAQAFLPWALVHLPAPDPVEVGIDG
ncbi:YczE/YyaS/YitT family protein [Nocardioides jishulii]|uniref:YitT family protein n=1 Tax=Nocardioides jishulii TaxID=2575440 RepID=A0A4U2YJX9_9ACTN|nr:hypothetical protein [Nocardioides jishulii]QCX27004.1 hypothetical protein FCL41_05260 [Nocardioides jishulii]TKI61486.1 hypothetical protein FC770_11895 [Nocardioides jishulii]